MSVVISIESLKRATLLGLAACLAIACNNSVDNTFATTGLVSNTPGTAPVTDPNLVNPWGLASGPSTPFWVANNGTGTLTVYSGDGTPQPSGSPLVVQVPPAGSAAPTGLVFNSTNGFPISAGGASGTSQFIFVGEDGRISAWSSDVSATNAVVVVDNSASGAVYKGVAVATDATNGPLLYATNFTGGTVDVYTSDLTKADLGANAFVDPNLPSGYAPFGIRAFGANVWVTYAVREPGGADDVPGAGNGIVDEYNTSGVFIRRFATGGPLNSPWGIEQAPASFTGGDDAVLIGNFGDGVINAFDPTTGELFDPLSDTNGNPITIDGLWSLDFGDGALAGKTNTLYFTAGVEDETGGLFGAITPNP